ncbi:MAG TPA: PA2169 family four-helix-bundle protein [Burkholderiaceae bacterium]|nr:PA2169 family four-helix-bundle protein [Burkholderiaceae bacterium]
MDRDDIVETLNDLIENCKDGEYGFRTCAEHAKSSNLKSVFTERAAGCRAGAEELQTLVARFGGKPDTTGTVSGAMHRGWVAVRGAVALDDDQAMLNECERGEDIAINRYRKALEQDLPADVEQVVRRQYEGARRNHDQIKALRDSNKTTA